MKPGSPDGEKPSGTAKPSKMGERTFRRLLIIGASAVVGWVVRKGSASGSWLAKMLTRKPPMLIRVALANKMVRIVWPLMAKGEIYQEGVGGVKRSKGKIWRNSR